VKEIRIHGRGGQGAVVTAELFAVAAYKSGKYSLGFPFLGGGGERRGAPVQAFVRLDDRPIRLRSKVYEPDYVIVLDPTLISIVDVTAGLKPDAEIIINSEKSPQELGIPGHVKATSVPASQIAMETMGITIMNTAIMGAFAGLTGEFDIDAIEQAIQEKFSSEVASKNILAARSAYDHAAGIKKQQGGASGGN